MIVLDTNVASELMKARPDAKAAAWFAGQTPEHLFLASPVIAELRQGIAKLPDGRRRQDLELDYAALTGLFAERVLAFDFAAAETFADIFVHRRTLGRPLLGFDGLIAAIARTNSASVATRNLRDFEECGVALIDPWAG
jgi:predicted nucleic acid-binding protein